MWCMAMWMQGSCTAELTVLADRWLGKMLGLLHSAANWWEMTSEGQQHNVERKESVCVQHCMTQLARLSASCTQYMCRTDCSATTRHSGDSKCMPAAINKLSRPRDMTLQTTQRCKLSYNMTRYCMARSPSRAHGNEKRQSVHPDIPEQEG